MRKIGFVLTISMIFVLALVGCGKTEAPKKDGGEKPVKQETSVAQPKKVTANDTVKTAILKAVEDNTHYSQAKDINGYIGTLAKSARTDSKKQQLEAYFKKYDMQYDLLRKTVIKHTDTTATVIVYVKTVATHVADGSAFKNNISEVEHHLVLEDNQWRISKSNVLDVTEIDANNIPKPNSNPSSKNATMDVTEIGVNGKPISISASK